MTTELLLLMAIGLVGGMFGGLLGIGSSIVILPALSILFAGRQDVSQQHVYQAAAMILNFFTSVPAVWWHKRQNFILTRLVAWIIPAAVVGILLGVTVSNLQIFAGQGSIYLRRLLGCFLVYVIGYNIYRLFKSSQLPDMTNEQAAGISPWKSLTLVGMPMGFVAGLLGVGGTLGVPLQEVFLKVPLRRTIANSATIIVVISLVGSTYKSLTLPVSAGVPGWEGLRLALILVPTCIAGGYLGSYLMYKLPRKTVRFVFLMIIGYAAVTLLLSTA